MIPGPMRHAGFVWLLVFVSIFCGATHTTPAELARYVPAWRHGLAGYGFFVALVIGLDVARWMLRRMVRRRVQRKRIANRVGAVGLPPSYVGK